jgi:hypothetical protein
MGGGDEYDDLAAAMGLCYGAYDFPSTLSRLR